jgi:CRISPR type III-A-associated RAMP protein Csm4
MNSSSVPAFLVRMEAAGPWRVGPDTGARESVDLVYHSDSLYSAVTQAMSALGWISEWLEATASSAAPAVRFSSCFPCYGDVLFVPPPRTLWPPPPSPKVRWSSARFVPIEAIERVLAERTLDENQWWVDAASGCLLSLARSTNPPLRIGVRSNLAVDRLLAGTEAHRTGCVEFAEGAGVWCLAVFSDDASRAVWADRIRAAFRLLADSGFGGKRSHGWGRALAPRVDDGAFPDLLIKQRAPEAPAEGEPAATENAWWLLSLFSPAPADTVDWNRGNYTLVNRGGRIESTAGWGVPKRLQRMVEEGSVLFAGSEPQGVARNVAPEGFVHPVYRAGYAVAVPIAVRGAA